jgi:hypothetical protein
MKLSKAAKPASHDAGLPSLANAKLASVERPSVTYK